MMDNFEAMIFMDKLIEFHHKYFRDYISRKKKGGNGLFIKTSDTVIGFSPTNGIEADQGTLQVN
jgi:hypothetical protein